MNERLDEKMKFNLILLILFLFEFIQLQPSTKCSETNTIFVEKLTNLSQLPPPHFFNVSKSKSIKKSMPASEKIHSTLTRGKGRVCLIIFVQGCLKSTNQGFPNILSTENFQKNIRKIQKQKQIQIEFTLYVNFTMKL